MTHQREAGDFKPEQALSRKELDPKVEGLFSDFREALGEDPQFLKAAGQRYLAPVRFSSQMPEWKNLPFAVTFGKGLDTWEVSYAQENRRKVTRERLLIRHYRLNNQGDIDKTLGVRGIVLRMPLLGNEEEKWKDGVEILYELFLVSSGDVHRKKNTASAIIVAEKMLADLKASPTPASS